MSSIIFSIQILMCTHVMVIKPTPFRDYMSPPQTPLRAYCCYSIPLWKMVDFDKAELSNHGALFCPCTIWALLEAMISLIPASRFLLWGLWISWEKYLPPQGGQICQFIMFDVRSDAIFAKQRIYQTLNDLRPLISQETSITF